MRKIDNIDWRYVPAAKTNIAETLKKMGWTPPSEDARFQQKWNTYKHLAWRNDK
jgi:hypothetical protein